MSWCKVMIIMKLCISYKYLEVMYIRNKVQVVCWIGGNEGLKNYDLGLFFNIVVD